MGTHVKSMSALNQSVQLAKINYLTLSLHLGFFLVNTLFYFYLVKKIAHLNKLTCSSILALMIINHIYVHFSNEADCSQPNDLILLRLPSRNSDSEGLRNFDDVHNIFHINKF